LKKFMEKCFLKPLTTALSMLGLISMTACSTTQHPYDPNDPLQTVNRATFAFNEQFDRFLLKPVAQGYKAITPSPVRTGVNNVFMNLDEIPTTINNVLQLSPETFTSFWRLLINTTVGIGGIFDVAAHAGLEHNSNDFGITLSTWGFSSAPYIVVPFLGSSNVRDGLGLIVDYEFFTVWPYIDNFWIRNGILAFDMVRLRANLLSNEDVLNTAAFDKYSLVRDAYVQYRNQKIIMHGGTYDQAAGFNFKADDLSLDLNDMDITSTDISIITPLQKGTATVSGAGVETAPATPPAKAK
jgi:phospholipid-binding lipoprotein MlaA